MDWLLLFDLHCSVHGGADREGGVYLEHVPLAELRQVPEDHLHEVTPIYPHFPRPLGCEEGKRDLDELKLLRIYAGLCLDKGVQTTVKLLHRLFREL